MANFSVCLIQPPGYLHSLALLEACQLLSCSLASLGHSSTLQVNQVQPGAVNIVVGYQLLEPAAMAELAPHHPVVYQLEQLSDREGWFTPAREAVLRRAWAVWDYSAQNAAFLRQRGLEKIQLLPLGYHPGLERIEHRPEADKDIDVLFYGSMNQRRTEVLDRLKSMCRTEALFGVYGEARDRFIARARILLNVHFYQAQILEQVRLSYLLNNRCFIVSEQAPQNPFNGGIVCGAVAELPLLCERFLADPEARRRVAEEGYRTFQSRPMTEYLKPVLESLPQ